MLGIIFVISLLVFIYLFIIISKNVALTFVLNPLRLIWFRVPTFILLSNLLCGVAPH